MSLCVCRTMVFIELTLFFINNILLLLFPNESIFRSFYDFL